MRTGTALLFFFEALDFIISILSLFLTLTWCLRCCQAQPEPQLNWGLAGSIFILSNHPPRKVFSESFPQSLDSINRLVLVPKIDPLKKKVCLKMIIRQSTVFFFLFFCFLMNGGNFHYFSNHSLSHLMSDFTRSIVSVLLRLMEGFKKKKKISGIFH